MKCDNQDCFYRTYEELKQHKLNYAYSRFASFYRTYEELKLDYMWQ